MIGRLAFPIFAYVLVEGFIYTKNINKYLLRLGIFALVSEVPFDLAYSGKWFSLELQNIYFTLFMGLLMLVLIAKTDKAWVQSVIGILTCVVAFLLKTDYDAVGILTIWLFFYFRGRKKASTILLAILMIAVNWLQGFATLAMIPISAHNHKRGPKLKFFFYLFYPVHFLILVLVHRML
jgi:hypothetical protein